MPTKKFFIAAGLVCVLAPAAFAALQGNRVSNSDWNVRTAFEDALALVGFQQFPQGEAEHGEGRLPPTAGHGLGKHRLLADLLGVNFSEFDDLKVDLASHLGGSPDPFSGDGASSAEVTPAAVAAIPEGVQVPKGAAMQSFAADGLGNLQFNGPGQAGIGFGNGLSAAGSAGSGGGGLPSQQLALDGETIDDLDDGPGDGSENGGDVAVVPLPATVWMMLAGLGGLGFASRRFAA